MERFNSIFIYIAIIFIQQAWAMNHPYHSSTIEWLTNRRNTSVHHHVDQGKIIGGQIVDSRCDFPFQVSIQVTFEGKWYHICGGTLISSKAVVTAAHCTVSSGFTNASDFRVKVGSLTVADDGTGAFYSVRKLQPHELYNSSTNENDISLFYLQSIVDLHHGCSPNIADLAAPHEFIWDSEPVITTGWGSTSEGGGVSLQLRYVEVPILNHDQCRSDYLKGIYRPINITDSMICAGYSAGGKDSCSGDSGGPLIKKGTRTLIGVVSFGYGCARPNYPGIYTDVRAHFEWIQRSVFAPENNIISSV